MASNWAWMGHGGLYPLPTMCTDKTSLIFTLIFFVMLVCFYCVLLSNIIASFLNQIILEEKQCWKSIRPSSRCSEEQTATLFTNTFSDRKRQSTVICLFTCRCWQCEKVTIWKSDRKQRSTVILLFTCRDALTKPLLPDLHLLSSNSLLSWSLNAPTQRKPSCVSR